MEIIRRQKAQPKSVFTSRYVGISHHPTVRKPWRAAISVWGKKRIIGYYRTEREAAEAYNEIARIHDRPLNVIEGEQIR